MDAALVLLDEQGLDGLSMRALAGRLRVDPMALYRHLDDKEALLAAVCDSALHEVSAEVARRVSAEDLHWRAALEVFAAEMGDALVRHPGLVPVLVHAPVTAFGVQLGRDMLERCRAGGLPDDIAQDALVTLLAYVLGSAVLAQSASFETAEVAQIRAADPDDPAIRLWDSDVLERIAGVATVLDGIEARAARAAAVSPSGRGRGRRSRGG